jgi:hypothetical protein
MNAQATKSFVKQAARSLRADGFTAEEVTEAEVARWSEYAQAGQVTSMADSTFGRFAKAVRLEVAAMIQEDLDTAHILGN